MQLLLQKQNPLVILLCCACALLCTTACVKEEKQASSDDVIKTGMVVRPLQLPVNLTAYNLLAPDLRQGTKSENEPATAWSVDSLIDWNKARQTSSPEGIVFTQVPFFLNDSLSCAAVSASLETLKDSVVPVKCFFILFEDCFHNLRKEYIVTMIPTPQQRQKRPDYDFFYKPNFSGVILYSDSAGTYLKNEILENGLIEQGKMLAKDSSTTRKRYISLYRKIRNTQTKSNDGYAWEDKLEGIVVTAIREPHPKPTPQYPENPRDPIKEMVSERESPNIGGGYTPKPSDDPCSLTTNSNGCRHSSETKEYTKDSEVELTAYSFGNDCIFLCWTQNGLIIGNAPTITVLMDKSKTVTAQYVAKSNTDCFRLAQLATDSSLMKLVEQLRKKIGPENIEYGVLTRLNGTTYHVVGKEGSLSFKFEQNVKYSTHFHTHTYTTGNIFTSAKDILCLRKILIENRASNISDFIYGTITQDKVLGLYVYDFTKFQRYFNAIATNENELEDMFIEKYNDIFVEKIRTLPMEELLPIYTNLLHTMGIKVVIGNSFENENEGRSIGWKSLEVTPDTSLNINQCF